MDKKSELYFGKAIKVEVTERVGDLVKFKLYCGYSCPQKMEKREADFRRWLEEKGFKAA